MHWMKTSVQQSQPMPVAGSQPPQSVLPSGQQFGSPGSQQPMPLAGSHGGGSHQPSPFSSMQHIGSVVGSHGGGAQQSEPGGQHMPVPSGMQQFGSAGSQ